MSDVLYVYLNGHSLCRHESCGTRERVLCCVYDGSTFAVIGSLPILAIHLWISLLWGIGASIGTGMGGLLMGALIGATSLGDKIWILVPWAWPVKLSMFPAVYLLSRTDPVFEDTVRQMMTGLAAVVIGTAVFLTSGMIWFRKWEGRA